jgi:hypothetical protein
MFLIEGKTKTTLTVKIITEQTYSDLFMFVFYRAILFTTKTCTSVLIQIH